MATIHCQTQTVSKSHPFQLIFTVAQTCASLGKQRNNNCHSSADREYTAQIELYKVYLAHHAQSIHSDDETDISYVFGPVLKSCLDALNPQNSTGSVLECSDEEMLENITENGQESVEELKEERMCTVLWRGSIWNVICDDHESVFKSNGSSIYDGKDLFDYIQNVVKCTQMETAINNYLSFQVAPNCNKSIPIYMSNDFPT